MWGSVVLPALINASFPLATSTTCSTGWPAFHTISPAASLFACSVVGNCRAHIYRVRAFKCSLVVSYFSALRTASIPNLFIWQSKSSQGAPLTSTVKFSPASSLPAQWRTRRSTRTRSESLTFVSRHHWTYLCEGLELQCLFSAQRAEDRIIGQQPVQPERILQGLGLEIDDMFQILPVE